MQVEILKVKERLVISVDYQYMLTCRLDLLRYISDKEKKVELVTIDYAGLTINCKDMKNFFLGDCKPDACGEKNYYWQTTKTAPTAALSKML